LFVAKNTAAQQVAQKLNVLLRRKEHTSEERGATLEDSVSISATQRFAIMQKLARHDTTPVSHLCVCAGCLITHTCLLLAQVSSSPVVLLRNMVDLKDVDDDLADEVAEECSKHGTVNNVQVWVNTPDGGTRWTQNLSINDSGSVWILVEFNSAASAATAQKVLNTRWFAGRQISAELYDYEQYKQHNL
jgi:hypothetical protein